MQVHASMAQSNLDFSGIEHNAFAELIEAALTGYERVGGKGAAVIMFTDVASQFDRDRECDQRSRLGHCDRRSPRLASRHHRRAGRRPSQDAGRWIDVEFRQRQ